MLEGVTVAQWCRELNKRSYFFVKEATLQRMLAAYSTDEHDVIVVDARKLVDRYEHAITLSSINTGAVAPAYARRCASTFLAIDAYPFTTTGAPAKPVVEITVSVPIPDIEEIVVKVERWEGQTRSHVIWPSRKP